MIDQPERGPIARVEPHTYTPLSLLERFRRNGICRHCYWPREGHPIHFWAVARTFGKRASRLTLEGAADLEFHMKAVSDD